MKKIEKDEFLVTYDEEIGVVYTPRKGVVRTTTPEHANKIKRFLLQYEQGKMSKEEMQRFEKYMRGSLAEYDDLPVDECLSLDERDILRRMEIIVTNECNLRCKYCYAHGGSYDMKVQKMSPYIACEYLEKLLLGKYRYVEYITFFGGEPTLCPDTILAICEFFENNVQKHNFEKMPKFSMISNGTLIDENMAEIIKKYDIGMTISIDGPEEINNLLRVDTFGKGSFERISRGIELLVKKDVPPLLLEATYTSKHKDLGYSKENIREYLKENFQVEEVLVADCCSGAIEDDLVYMEKEVHEYEIKENNLIAFMCKCLTNDKFVDYGCDVCYGSCTLTPNGEIYPCHFFVNHKEYRLAYYKDNAFDFSNYANVLCIFEKLRNLKNPRCVDCWAKPVCHYCPAQLLMEEEESIRNSCNTRKLQQEKVLLECIKINSART